MSGRIDRFAPSWDANEVHWIEIAAPPETVYGALWSADLGGSWIVRGLIALRSLPRFLFRRTRRSGRTSSFTLHNLIDAGFGRLDEDPGREVVLGITGRFWRPAGNADPFDRSSYEGPVPPGRARAVWNFVVRGLGDERSVLSTETRIVCADSSSRRKFLGYWFVVRPFSGLIRRLMLRAVQTECSRRRNHLEIVE